MTAASGLLAPSNGNKTSPSVEQKGKGWGEEGRKTEKEKKRKRK